MTTALHRRACPLAVSLLGVLAATTAVADADKPGEGVTVTPIFPTITEEHFRGQVAVIGLQELGYDVETPKETDYPTMMMALSYGDADFTVHLWDKLHEGFYERAGGDDTMVKVGDVMTGVSQGYLIDKKTAEEYDIDSLEDLRDPEVAALFDTNDDGKADLTGCNPGWGCEVTIDHHLAAYDLMDTVTQNRGSYFALMADTITRYEQGQPILYYTWVPQWITAKLVPGKDVVWLEVPYTDLPDGNNDVNTEVDGKNLGFAVDTIKAVLNKDFAEENPAAREFLSHLSISPDAESAQNLKMQEGESSEEDIRRHAEQWVDAHREEFDEWLNEARAAAE
ncbi:glycine betaine/L-proline ABC transporter substrate-binding protein ProX [Halomonas organivorans]|uniref:Glycine betaine/proline transport system substrate-binding protein n=1 Tax=Halomonas organivorans TaxID=257772 RepID=A0A7W5BV59_9GAMM|nr:glycine betaine/L-proline ABC transporter substrate-binding protein ProX [Halomonas organivorans]MBB3139720.1 glycine betaine/proline transport system substrate-binding protein [Halomonas organivorans]